MKKYEKIAVLAGKINELADAQKKNEENAQTLRASANYLNEYAKLLLKQEEQKKLSKVNTKWTDKEDEKLKSQFEKGWKVARIAKAHSRSLSGIVSRLVKLGLIVDDGENGKKRWTEEEDAALLERAESGAPLEKMANAHKRSMSGILSRLEKLGYDIDER